MTEDEKKKTGYFCICLLFVVYCCLSGLSEYQYNLVGICTGWILYTGTAAETAGFGEGNEKFKEQFHFGAGALGYGRNYWSQSCDDHGVF